MTEAKKPLDVEALERDYRTGNFTDRELGEKYGVSHTAIQNRARRNGWQKDIAGAVRNLTAARLIEAEVAKVANNEVAKRVAKQVANAVPATIEVVAAMAEVNSAVILRHRTGLRKIGELRDKMLAEIEAISDAPELFEQLGEIMGGADEDGKEDRMGRAYRKVISLSSRIADTKSLAEIDERVRKGEREAFGLDAADATGESGRELTDAERSTRLARLLDMARKRQEEAK